VVADGGGVGKDFSGGVIGEGGLGGVKDRLLVEPEGETGGEHLALHAGQFLFDDNQSIRWSKQKHCPQQRTFLGLFAGSKQMPQSVSNFSLWNRTIPFDLLLDQEFDLQLLRLAGMFVFIAMPDFVHSSTVTAEGGVSDGFEIERGVSAPRSM